jgi:hypothetical protein
LSVDWNPVDGVVVRSGRLRNRQSCPLVQGIFGILAQGSRSGRCRDLENKGRQEGSQEQLLGGDWRHRIKTEVVLVDW